MKLKIRQNITPNWIQFLAPLAYLVITLVIDYLVPFTTFTPLLGISALMIFAFFFSPFWMIFWGAVYAVVVGIIFLNPLIYSLMNTPSHAADPVTPFLRTFTFLLGSIMSCILNLTINRLKKGEMELGELLSKIPSPIITSDSNGTIKYVNSAAEQVIGMSHDELHERNIFDLLTVPGHQGTLIADYLRRFDTLENMPPLKLQLWNTSYLGETQLLSASHPKRLMTILHSIK